MLVKVSSSSQTPVHLWTYMDFKTHHHANLKEYDMSGNLINYIVYELTESIDEKYTSSLGSKCQIIYA